MKQKKPFLLILWAIMLCMTLFMLSSCLDLDDEDKTLVNVSLENVPTEAIDLGKFDEQTEVYLKLEYDDDSITRERITQSFFAEEYQHYFEEVGTHEFKIERNGFILEFSITFKDPTKSFTVKFLNVSDEIVSEQTVEEGKSAISPTEEEMFVDGWRFLGTYDKSFDEVEEDLIVKGEYVKTWTVSFYNNNNELIKSYIVDDKEASPEPTEQERAVEGYTFVSWDSDFNNVINDTSVYGKYEKIDEQEQSIAEEYFTYALLGDGTYEISYNDAYVYNEAFQNGDFSSIPQEVVIPSTYNNKPVTKIADEAFSCYFKAVPDNVSLVIPEGVTSIGRDAFMYLRTVKKLVLPNSLNIISSGNSYLFGNLDYNEYNNGYYVGNDVNPYLVFVKTIDNSCTTFEINDKTKIILDFAFSGCQNLTSISLPDSIFSVDSSAFNGCDNLVFNEYENAKYLGNADNPYMVLVDIKDKSITACTINDNTKIIMSRAFSGCNDLTSVTISKNVKMIGDFVFNECRKLLNIYVSDENELYKSMDGVLYSKDGKTLVQYAIGRQDEKFIVPSGVTDIGMAALGNSQIQEIELPKSLIYIGADAFYWSALKYIDIPNGVKNVGFGAFMFCRNITDLVLPNSIENICEAAFSYTDIVNITFEDNSKITSIKYETFAYNYSLENLSFGKNGKLKYLGSEVFYGCRNLTSIDLPSSLTIIDERFFRNDAYFENINVDENNKKYKSIDGNLYSKDGKTLIKYASGKTATIFQFPTE